MYNFINEHLYNLKEKAYKIDKQGICNLTDENNNILKKLYVSKIFNINYNIYGGGDTDELIKKLETTNELAENINKRNKDILKKFDPIIKLLELIKNIDNKDNLDENINTIIQNLNEIKSILTENPIKNE